MGSTRQAPPPIAIVGIGMRLPGGVSTPAGFWDFIVNKKDGKCRVPTDRYDVNAFYGSTASRQRVATEYGYYLDLNLKALDGSFLAVKTKEVENVDPQQRLLLEVCHECLESAGSTNLKGSNAGVFVGNFGEDWHNMAHADPQASPNLYRISTASDFMTANRISSQFDFRGPSITTRTACSASMTSLHLACQALYNGDCPAALVAGSSLILNPSMTMDMTAQGVLSPTGSCKTFDASADGFARGEAINAILIKPLESALRDNDPIRAVIRATAVNSDGGTTAIGQPSQVCQEAMIRRAYEVAGITDISLTPFVECHGTGTQTGDPIEAKAVANVFAGHPTYIGSVKSNFGHAEGAAGLNSVIKAVLALENKIIPPNIHYSSPNPHIPFVDGDMRVPTEPEPWPKNRPQRISINSFGIGGANAHAIIESAASYGVLQHQPVDRGKAESVPNTSNGISLPAKAHTEPSMRNGHFNKDGYSESAHGLPRLFPVSAACVQSLKSKTGDLNEYIESSPDLDSLAYTLTFRREHLAYRTWCVADTLEEPLKFGAIQKSVEAPSVIFVFTGQGAQWSGMGRDMIHRCQTFHEDIIEIDRVLQALPEPPTWCIEDTLCSDDSTSVIDEAEFTQPLCTAVQIALVNFLAKCGVLPEAVVGHSSGEIAAAYAAGALTLAEAIICAYYRGVAIKRQARTGSMAAIGLGRRDIESYLAPGIQVACENSSSSVTISGEVDGVQNTIEAIKTSNPDVFVRQLRVNVAYHSDHMQDCGKLYEELLGGHIVAKAISTPFYSSATGLKGSCEMDLGPAYWNSNLQSPVLFSTAIEAISQDLATPAIFLEIGPHSALQAPLQQIFRENTGSKPKLYIPTLLRNSSSMHAALAAVGQLYSHGYKVDFSFINPEAAVLPDLPCYPWDRSAELWHETRVSKAWRSRSVPHHELLGSRCLEAPEAEPAWRNIFHLHNVLWIADHRLGDQVLFPLAGYISMLGEAIRQVFRSEAYSIRHLVMKSGMLIPKMEPIEIMTTTRQVRVTELTNSSWYEFTVYSYNGTTWVQHCVAQGKGIEDKSPPPCDTAVVPNARKLRESIFYRCLRNYGLDFGPAFQNLQDILYSRDEFLATARIRSTSAEPGARYTAHPFLIDGCLQLATVASVRGRFSRGALVLPSYFRKIEVYSGDIESVMHAEVDREANGSFNATIAVINQQNETVMKLEGGVWLPVGVDVVNSEGLTNSLSARIEWRPRIEFCKLDKYVSARHEQHEGKLALQQAAALVILEMLDLLASAPPASCHIDKFCIWLSCEREKMVKGKWEITTQEAKQWAMSDKETRKILLDDILARVGSSCGDYGTSFVQLARKLTDPDALRAIISGATSPTKMLSESELDDVFHSTPDTIDASELLYLAAHSKPNLRILEIGSRSTSVTKSIVAALTSSSGPIFSEYTFTTSCPEDLACAQQRLGDKHELVYKLLDVSKSPREQDFELQSYDVVMYSNTLDMTAIANTTLATIHSLLRPRGWFCVWKPVSRSVLHTWRFIPLALGLRPEWWQDHEPSKANIHASDSTEPWHEALRSSGFAPQLIVSDDVVPFCLNTLIVSRAEPRKQAGMKSATILYDTKKHEFALMLAALLEEEDVMVHWTKITDCEQFHDEDIISTLDLEKPYFYDFTQETYATFLEYMRKAKTRIIWLTRPAQVRCCDPRYGLVPGFMRTLRQELGVHLFTIELDVLSSAAADSTVPVLRDIRNLDLLSSPETIDYEFYVADDEVHVGRYHWFSMSTEAAAPVKDQGKSIKRLKVGEYGLINSLHWLQQDEQLISSGKVEIQVKWGGLNFRDIMVAMGVVPAAKDNFGIESSGIVTRVGEDVENFAVGDKVIVTGSGVLATRIVVSAHQVAHLPRRFNLEEGASMAVAYSTAIMALVQIGNLRRGQSVLIHTACGSVGLAAISISKALGFEIYATVGSEAKVKYLEQKFGLPSTRIYRSRDDSFYDDIMRVTEGRGVDLVLNSLSGELLHASWRCVARKGKMVEIGKRDIVERGQLPLEMFRQNRTCFGLDLEDLADDIPGSNEKTGLENGIEAIQLYGLPAIEPRHIFTLDEIPDAFRLLRKGQHIGKVILKFPDNDDDIPALSDSRTALFDDQATYLFVGGLGGLGKSITVWFIEKGAKNFVFLSRSAGTSDADQQFIKDVESNGGRAIPVAGSVTNADDVQRAVAAAETPIAGVIQMSMLIHDLPLSETNYENWSAGIATKVTGTWNLHHALADAKLDFFVLFSSLIGLWGQPGQANYAAANTFLDSFVHYRHGLGLPCSVIDLGPVEDIGWVSQNEKMKRYYNKLNVRMVQEKDVLEAVQLSIQSSRAAHTRIPCNGYVNVSHIAVGLAAANSAAKSPLQHDIRTGLYRTAQVIEESSDDDASELMRKVLKGVARDPHILYQDSTLQVISLALSHLVCKMLELSVEDIDVSRDFVSLGVDSLHGVELRDRLRRVMLLDVSLIDIKNSATIEGLGKLILEKLKAMYRLNE